MKKKIFYVFIAIFFSTATYAQFSIGVKAGLNYSTITNLNNISFTYGSDNMIGNGENSYKTGFYIGAFVNKSALAGFLAFQPELIYSRQGGKNKGVVAGTNDSYSSKIMLDYINIPLMLQVYVIPKFVNVEVGPQVGFLLKSQQEISYSTNNSRFESTTSIDNINKVDFSLAVGVGVKIPIIPIGLNARYIFGLTETYKDINGATNESKPKNGVLQVSAFLRF